MPDPFAAVEALRSRVIVRLEYKYHAHTVITEAGDYCVYGERIEPGSILYVLTCYLHMPASKITDVATILLRDGSTDITIRSRARDAAKQGMSALNPFLVGEYQRIVGHSPDSDANDKISLSVIGELWPLKDWRQAH